MKKVIKTLKVHRTICIDEIAHCKSVLKITGQTTEIVNHYKKSLSSNEQFRDEIDRAISILKAENKIEAQTDDSMES